MRIVHLGLGNFFRAHQAWYTASAPDGDRWPITAFTGRSPELADALNAQGGRYSLQVPLPAAELTAYRAALLDRFTNPRIRHTLAQIAADGSQKVPIRVLPVLRAERSAGRTAPGAVRILAAWIAHLRGAGAPIADAGAAPYRQRAASPQAVLELLTPDLAGDAELVAAVTAALDETLTGG